VVEECYTANALIEPPGLKFWVPVESPATVSYQLVNRLISVNYSFRHVGTIRLTLAPHPLEILSHLHGISTPLAPEDSV
jgi:hypothetical protein